MKAQRQALLLELLEEGLVDSQQTAVTLLAERGVAATQATVSRDLDELGAVRVRDGGQVRYAMREQSSQYGVSLQQVMRDFVVSRMISGNIIIFHTPPGHAQVVAAALDRSHIEGVLGVVAGDDTLFICAAEELGAKRVLATIEGALEDG